jgi:succinate dehydrogenase / fumarate reductase cytochrome b subunit
MTGFRDLFRTAVGKKAVMAVSGIVLFGFVVAHLLGNLKIYQGAETLNTYAEHLRTMGEPILPRSGLLWILRSALLLAVGLHLWAAWETTRQSWAGRPTRYQVFSPVAATYAARTMRWGGVLILLYVLFHLADLTWGTVNPGFVPGDVYRNTVASFQRWPVAALYVVANVALGLHLYHGLWSFFQSLGWNNPKYNAWRRHFATAFAWIVTIGNVSFPVAVLTGWVR